MRYMMVTITAKVIVVLQVFKMDKIKRIDTPIDLTTIRYHLFFIACNVQIFTYNSLLFTLHGVNKMMCCFV